MSVGSKHIREIKQNISTSYLPLLLKFHIICFVAEKTKETDTMTLETSYRQFLTSQTVNKIWDETKEREDIYRKEARASTNNPYSTMKEK